jgi:hypothetical protein
MSEPSNSEQNTSKPQRYVSPHGYTDDYGPNVSNILTSGMRVVVGRVPASVRAELRTAVKDGVLGHLKKDGLKPEIFFHPSHKNGAIERQKREAAYSVSCIAGVMATPAEVRAAITASVGATSETDPAAVAAIANALGSAA